MKRIVALVMVAALAVALGGCGSSGGGSSSTSASTISVNAASQGKTVEAKVGDTLDVALPGNPSTGYTWVAKDLPSLLQQEGEPKFTQGGNSGAVGTPGTLNITFKATRAGSGKLVLEYERPWETTATPANTFSTTVTVK